MILNSKLALRLHDQGSERIVGKPEVIVKSHGMPAEIGQFR
jgi:hypothetical protein